VLIFLPACRADLSQQGLTNSCGLMVNYLYNMEEVVSNNQQYLLEHSIAASPAVQQLLG
jgi:malonyl-CoA decarboxylase